MDGSTVVAVLALVAFAGFIAWRVDVSKKKKGGTGIFSGGGGGRPGSKHK